MVVATDAPLLPGQCKALARRVPLGIARTGSTSHHTSGDIFLAFSTARQPRLAPVGTMPGQLDGYDELRVLPWHEIDPLYGGVVQAVEEAIIDALVTATAVDSGGRLLPALPHGQLLQIMRDHRAL